jgi:hypothetical protein
MKRLLVLAALVAPLWGCAQPAEAPANVSAPTANANANTTAAPAAPTAAGVSEAAITDHEKQIWDALKRKDYDAFGQMLASDFTYVSSDGIYDKAGTVQDVKEYNPTEQTLSNWKFVPIDDDAAIVAYEVLAKGTSDGKPLPGTPLRSSSVWVKRDNKWVAVFHQDCPVMKMPENPPPGPAKNANANTNAANANANTAATETAEAADPIEKEKRVWEELKRKDYNAFASDLADNSIEVWPEGVYDRSGSIEGVKQVDFTKMTLSNFKEVKIDKDASVVTYLVTEADKKESRHSTVWVKRGAKWFALLHHGTPVMKAAANK